MKFKEFIDKLFTKNTLDKKVILLVLRWVLVVLVSLWWWFTSNNAAGIALLLVLSSTTLIRMQFRNFFFYILLEQAACLMTGVYWPLSIFALIIPSFESGIIGSLLTFIPVIVIVLLKTGRVNAVIYVVLNFMAFFTGYVINAWSIREEIYLNAADKERKQRYELEQLKNELLAANNEVAKLVEIAERNRIAQQLHDNVGHEIAGALIALQTYKKLKENDDSRAETMLDNVLKRVESSSIKLRETVYQLRPSTEGGILRLQKLCEEFSYCSINYRFIGDKDIVPAIVWVILEPCLKEALTNVSKYSKATEVQVKFDITQYIVRMNIKDNGVGAGSINSGMGLFGIRERIRAAGGTVAVDGSDGFMITCILPIDIY